MTITETEIPATDAVQRILSDALGNDGKAFAKRWGAGVARHGFTMLPHVLFAMQARLGLSAPQMIVLLHLFDHWWHDHKLPFPTIGTMATRMGIHPRHVTRILNDLQDAGFVLKVVRRGMVGEQRSNFYDLSGTLEKVRALEPEFKKAKDEARDNRKLVETPRSRRKSKGA